MSTQQVIGDYTIVHDGKHVEKENVCLHVPSIQNISRAMLTSNVSASNPDQEKSDCHVFTEDGNGRGHDVPRSVLHNWLPLFDYVDRARSLFVSKTNQENLIKFFLKRSCHQHSSRNIYFFSGKPYNKKVFFLSSLRRRATGKKRLFSPIGPRPAPIVLSLPCGDGEFHSSQSVKAKKL